MFLDRLLSTNPALAELAFSWHQAGVIQPDTYLLDMDTIVENARMMQAAADKFGITLYFMLKQLGRNPLVAHELQDAGLFGAVCVDWREAVTLSQAGVRLGNVGHLVQTPTSVLPELVSAQPDIMTVYTVEKAKQISAIAAKRGIVQPIMLRIIGDTDVQYSGQHGGFHLDDLEHVAESLEQLPGVRIAGVTSFPCFLFSEPAGEIEPLPNTETVLAASSFLEKRGHDHLQRNMPSANCLHSIPLVARLGGTHIEPGHALTGTTPYHAACLKAEERVGYVYVSEVSHNYDGNSYCFAGGFYRRGHLRQALVGDGLDSSHKVKVAAPDAQCIDYHFSLSHPEAVGDTVLMCFRTQLFVTRSEVAVVRGLSSNNPTLEGIFNTQGIRLR